MHWRKFSLRMPGGYDATSYDCDATSDGMLRIILIGIGIQFEVTAGFAPCTCFVTSTFAPMCNINVD